MILILVLLSWRGYGAPAIAGWPGIIRQPARRRKGEVRTNRRRLSVLLFTVLVVATACGGSDAGGGDTASPGSAGKTITISNFEFAPEVLEAKVGDTITVDNKDSAEHTVTAKDKSFDTGRFASGTKTFTVTKAGRFEYVCDVHPFMTNRVIQVVG
ncbi:MAG: cupredoxin domain-containing protein [Acidimicrobiales bacterium]